MAEANARNVLIALIESCRGVDNAEAILAVPGIDVGWLGHFDLTSDLGIPAQFDPSRVPRRRRSARRSVAAHRQAARSSGRPARPAATDGCKGLPHPGLCQ